MIPNKDYIGSLPGAIHDKDGTLTDIMTALGVKVDPISSSIKNDGRLQPPVATFRVGDKEYSLADVLDAVITRLDGSGGSSGGGGSGITVIECEFVADEVNKSYTLTNADLIAAALTDIEQNPTHLWNYGLYVHIADGDLAGNGIIAGYTANHEPVYGFGSQPPVGAIGGTIAIITKETHESGGETITEYRIFREFLFTQDDIDENGTARSGTGR